jgi:hypothetical protein
LTFTVSPERVCDIDITLSALAHEQTATMENSPSPKTRAKALLCLGFRAGVACNAKAVSGGTICKHVECLAMKEDNPTHHTQYAIYKLHKLTENAISWRIECQQQYKTAHATRLLRIQTENRRLLSAGNLKHAIDAKHAQAEADETERLLNSLQTMSLEELLSQQAMEKEEYGFGALMGEPDDGDENLDY